MSNISSGLGYIIVPLDVDRDKYIEECFVNETVSIYLDSGGMSLNNVKITKECLENIEFPDKVNELGQCVVYIIHPKSRLPIIIGTLSKIKQSNLIGYKQINLRKSFKENFSSIKVDGVLGQITLSTFSEEGGGICVTCGSPEEKSLFEMNIQGYLSISSTEVNINADLITFGIESKKAIIGETFIDNVISPLIEVLESFKVVTSQGNSISVEPTTLQKLNSIKKVIPETLSNRFKFD